VGLARGRELWIDARRMTAPLRTDVHPGIRTIELRGPSAREEALGLYRALSVVAFASLLLVGRHWDEGKPSQSALLMQATAYQRRFSELAPAEQRLFRQLQEGLTEVENARPALPDWPPPQALADQGIPPFAADPLVPGMQWTLHRMGPTTVYLGMPAAPGKPAWLMHLQESADPPDTPQDETHHKLSTGLVLHVSLWELEGGRVDAAAEATLERPYLGNWKQILSKEN
jgi:hypothetical protein